jgi:hypothetical protein
MAEPKEAQDRAVMERKIGAIHRKMPTPERQLPITECTHKAGIVGDADLAAVLTLLDVSAKHGGAARLDGGHHAALALRELAALRCAERIAVAAEMSATSRTGRMRADHSGGVTARLKRSRGLVVAAIRLVATCA